MGLNHSHKWLIYCQIEIMKIIALTIVAFLLPVFCFSQSVGINSNAPTGTLHIKGSSSIGYPNLRITDTVDNFSRIKMETLAGGNRFWDIAANSTAGSTLLNIYHQNDTLGLNVFQIAPELGINVNRSFSKNMYTRYYASQQYQGYMGFVNEHLLLGAVTDNGEISLRTRNTSVMTLDTIGRVGIGTVAPKFLADVRSKSNDVAGGELQLSTKDETNFLRFFGGRLNDRNPFMAFNDLDTFHLVTTSADFSTYQRRMTIFPNGFMGSGTLVRPLNNLKK